MRIVCIDDEPLILDYLSLKLQEIGDVVVAGTYIHSNEGLNYILQNEVDVVILDINLPEIKGVDLARKITDEKPDILIAFLTAHQEYAIEAFELDAIDYIVKPIRMERLQKTVERARRKLAKAQPQNASSEKEQLFIQLSNYLAFSTDGEHFSPLQWRTSKAEELFLFLLHNRGDLIDKFQIKEIVWEDFDISDSLLHTTVSYIRKTLKDYKNYLSVELRGDAYYLDMKQVHVDVFLWEKKLNSLNTLSSLTLKEYEQVMKLNQDIYLRQYSYLWIEAERERLEKIWTDTMKQMASLYVIENEVNKAFSTYKSICKRQPDHEEVHFLLMKLYANNGYFKRAINQYERLFNYLQNHLDTQPSASIKQWYNNLLFVIQNE